MYQKTYSTPNHDLVHRWIFDDRNRYKVLELVAQQRGFDLDKENCSTSIDIERRIFYKESRKFIVDGIIDLSNLRHCCFSSSTSNWVANGGAGTGTGTELLKRNGRIVKSFTGKELHLARDAIYRRMILTD